MQNLPILLDQDGVLADFVKGLYCELKWALKPEMYELLPPINSIPTFYVEDAVNTGNQGYDRILKQAIRDVVDNFQLFKHLSAIDNAVHYAHELKIEAAKEGISVLICTAPHVENRSCHSDKSEWIMQKLGKDWAKQALMVRDKTLVQGLVLIDDKPIITGLLTPTWQHVIFDASYNQASVGPRIYGWNEQSVATIMEHAVKMQIMNGLRNQR